MTQLVAGLDLYDSSLPGGICMTQLFAGWDLYDTALYRVGSVCHGCFLGGICMTALCRVGCV